MTNADEAQRGLRHDEDGDPLLDCVTGDCDWRGRCDMGREKAIATAETDNQRLDRESRSGKLSKATGKCKGGPIVSISAWKPLRRETGSRSSVLVAQGQGLFGTALGEAGTACARACGFAPSLIPMWAGYVDCGLRAKSSTFSVSKCTRREPPWGPLSNMELPFTPWRDARVKMRTQTADCSSQLSCCPSVKPGRQCKQSSGLGRGRGSESGGG